jgi:hypothetical protein
MVFASNFLDALQPSCVSPSVPDLASVDFEKTVVQTIWGNQARTPEYKEERE